MRTNKYIYIYERKAFLWIRYTPGDLYLKFIMLGDTHCMQLQHTVQTVTYYDLSV